MRQAKIEKRVELLEQYLVVLAERCWQDVGTDLATEIFDDIQELKKPKKQKRKKHARTK